MVSVLKTVFAVAVIASAACSVFAIKCYQCESLTNPKCGEHFEHEDRMVEDCARIAPPRFLSLSVRNATGCMKQRLESVAGRPQIVRTCYFGDVSNTRTGCESDPSLPFIKQYSCDVCVKDQCNSSSNLGPIVGAIVLFFGIARMLS